jgi:hypothetical protein
MATTREQLQLSAHFDEAAAHVENAGAVVAPNVSNGLEVGR